jgi:integrase
MTLLSSVLTIARREWGLIAQNPLSDVRKPSPPPPRDRRVSDDEIEKLMQSAGTDLTKATARAIHAFRFAIETAMRAGEIISLTDDSVDKAKRVATLPHTKNGTARQVPLSKAAVGLLNALPETDGPLFGLTSQQIDALFRKARDNAEIENLKFHDSRHEAITRLAKKLDVLSLARMVGHKDIKMLMVYYNETAEELAQRLD